MIAVSAKSEAGRGCSPPRLDVDRLRRDFPILGQRINGKPLIYLDNAATAQKPQAAIDAESHYYAGQNANIHRGIHTLSVRATELYEQSRVRAQRWIGAPRKEEIIFVRSSTEGINLVAQSWGRPRLRPGDEIVISHMEHHSNIVPWQLLCEQTGAVLRIAPINDRGELIVEEYERLLNDRTKIVSTAHISNSLGTINPVQELVQLAHRHGAVAVIDGAQGVPHLAVDVRELDCDFYTFSSHKFFGPTGVGVLYGKFELLDQMPPYQGGGDMIKSVSFEKTIYNDVPHKFEAGTPNIAGVVGLGATIEYVGGVGMEAIAAYEDELLSYANEAFTTLTHVRQIGTARHKAAIVSFVVDGVHPHDVGTILDQEGIAVRTGHHCAQPVMDRFGVPATSRASMAFYNTREEIDALVTGVRRVVEVFH